MTSSQKNNPVFADWLDVTFAPTDFHYREVTSYLQRLDGHVIPSKPGVDAWSIGEGVISVESRSKWARVSASGASLKHLRALSLFNDFLTLLSESPHRVTRLDAALDLPIDGSKVVKSLRRKFPQLCCLSSKPQRTKSILSARASDGIETGIFYVGKRGTGGVTGRVYDKAHEAFERRGEMLPPTTRFELTFGKAIGASLRDASDPSSLFWKYASPSLLKRPPGIPEWVPGQLEGWDMVKQLHEPAAVLKRRVENSPDIAKLIELASEMGPNGFAYLQALMDRRINALRPTVTPDVTKSGN